MEIRKKVTNSPTKGEHYSSHQILLFRSEVRILQFGLPSRKYLRKSLNCGGPTYSRVIQSGRNKGFNQWGHRSARSHVSEVSPSENFAIFPGNPRGRSHRSTLPPTPEIELSIILKALHSFPVGAGPGPDGLRADFLKGLVGHSLESPLLPILQQFLQVLAGADVPEAVQPWQGSSTQSRGGGRLRKIWRT